MNTEKVRGNTTRARREVTEGGVFSLPDSVDRVAESFGLGTQQQQPIV
jgi:hypothetical protein